MILNSCLELFDSIPILFAEAFPPAHEISLATARVVIIAVSELYALALNESRIFIREKGRLFGESFGNLFLKLLCIGLQVLTDPDLISHLPLHLPHLGVVHLREFALDVHLDIALLLPLVVGVCSEIRSHVPLFLLGLVLLVQHAAQPRHIVHSGLDGPCHEYFLVLFLW